MANNYLEQFSIGFGFDLKNLKADSKKLEKILTNLDGKKVKGLTKEEKLEKRIRTPKRKSEAENMQALLKKEKADKAATTSKKKAQVTAEQKVSAAIAARQASEHKRELDLLKVGVKRKQVVEQRLAAERKLAVAMQSGMRKQAVSNLTSGGSGYSAKRSASAFQEAFAREDLIKQSGALATEIRGSDAFRGLAEADKSKYGARLGAASATNDIKALKALQKELNKVSMAHRKYRTQMKRTNVVQKGLTDSTRNMIRSYASLFALFEGVSAVKRVGQEFESLRASMLVVSDNSAHSAQQLKFVRGEAMRLGVDLRAASKAYMQLRASAGDALGEQGVKQLFTSVLGISKAFGMNLDDTKGTFKSFVQINE